MKSTKKAHTASNLLSKFSEYIAQALQTELPTAVQERARQHFLDTLAAMISGSQLLAGRRGIEFAVSQGGVKEACIAGSNIMTTAISAALANGMSAHADETDDTYYRSLVHPGCSIVPAALAMAERHRRNGKDLLSAIALGYDVCARISHALGVEKFRSSGHSTHSFGGTFGSAVAAGVLSGLNLKQVRYLISYASQQASGLSCWARDPDHIEKAFHFGGMPARNGVTAAVMVAMGFTGVEDVFSGDRDFFHAYGKFATPELLIKDLGVTYEIMNTAIKRWSVGYPIQAPLDAVSNLISKHHLKAGDIDHISVLIDKQGAYTVNKRKMADINIQHLVALMIIDGEITFENSHDERRLNDPSILNLKDRIELRGSDQLSRTKTTQAIVETTLKNGKLLRHHTKAVRGTATNPMTREEVADKSLELLTPVLGIDRAQKLNEIIWKIDKMTDVRGLRKFLRPLK